MGYAVRQTESSGKIVSCALDVEVGDYVFSASNQVGKARSDSISTMPAVGYVVRKLKNNKCVIVQFELEKNQSGLIPKTRYYISPSLAGKITNIPPSNPTHILQCVAESIGENERLIHIDPTNYVIRS